MNVLAIVDNIVEKAIDRVEASSVVLDFTSALPRSVSFLGQATKRIK